MKKIFFESITNLLKEKNINVESTLKKSDIFYRLNTLDNSNKNDLTFFHNNKYFETLKKTKAKACFIKNEFTMYLNNSCTPIIVDDPYLAYALVSNFVYPRNKSNGRIHDSVNISSLSTIDHNVQINANVIIKDNCKINKEVIIHENVVIGPEVNIGENSIIMPNCTLSNTIIGKNCLIQSGAVIGDKGFGFTPDQKIEIKHIGNVIVGNNVDIGSNTTIDRGTIGSTLISDNCRIDNLVQIGHNVQIGKNTIVAAQVGISGSTKIGAQCIVGGQAGFAGHLTIGNNVKVAAKSGVTKNIGDNCIIGGFPARDIKIWKKSIVKLYDKLK